MAEGQMFFVVRPAAQTMVLARSSPCASAPKLGDRILIFKQPWLQLVLCGHKTLEIRGAPYKAGKYYFGSGGQHGNFKHNDTTVTWRV